jgi:hypothetical protein
MSNIRTTARRVENFLVAKQGQTAIPTSGNLYTPGTLADGQLAVVSSSMFGSVGMNVYTDATPTITEAPVIVIAQGNANSTTSQTATATYPLWVRPYEVSKEIDGRREVRVTKQSYRAPAFSTWYMTAPNVLSNTAYMMEIAFKGRRQEEMYSLQEQSSLNVGFTTPDFSSTGLNLNTAQARGWILNTVAYNVNRNSKALTPGARFAQQAPVVAFSILKAGGSGVAIGGVSPIAAASSVPVITTPQGTKNFVFTADQATAVKNAALAIAGGVIADLTWTIVPATYTASLTATNDAIIYMALDETQVYVDYVPQVKVRLNIGLRTGFLIDSTTLTQTGYADEGQGIGRVLDLQYKATEGQRKYANRHTEDPVITFPSPVDTALVYTTYVIHHSNVTETDMFTQLLRPAKEIVLIPQYSTGTTTNPYLATFEAVLNSWLASAVSNASIVTPE